jgi:hypothetical protein
MKFLIKAICILALSVLCWVVIKGYSRFMKKRLSESLDMLTVIEAVRRGIATRLMTPRECLSAELSLSSLGVLEFCKQVSCGKTLSEAFSAGKPSLSLSRECRDILSEYFSSFGTGYREDEIRLADDVIERYGARLSEERAQGVGDAKVFKSVAVAVTLGVIILII